MRLSDLVKEPDHRPASGNVIPTVGYYLAFLALGLATAALGPALPGLGRQTRSEPGAVSILFVAGAVGHLIGSLQGGRWFDRMPGHWLLAAALLLLAVMLGMMPLVSDLWLLAVVLLVLCAAEGAVDVGGNTLLVWVHQDRVGPWMNGLHLCWSRWDCACVAATSAWASGNRSDKS
jgi:FHS family Na+ dependent glucose MFS transporter 1